MIDKQMKALYEQNRIRDENDTEEIISLHKKEITVLCANLDDTIEYLTRITPKELFYISEVFDEVSHYWKSDKLIKAMENSANKCHGKLKEDVLMDVDFARKAMHL